MIIVLGRVPLFYYVLHIYLIHLFAIVAGELTGYDSSKWIFSGWINNSPDLKGYGFNLGVVYLVWMAVVHNVHEQFDAVIGVFRADICKP